MIIGSKITLVSQLLNIIFTGLLTLFVFAITWRTDSWIFLIIYIGGLFTLIYFQLKLKKIKVKKGRIIIRNIFTKKELLIKDFDSIKNTFFSPFIFKVVFSNLEEYYFTSNMVTVLRLSMNTDFNNYMKGLDEKIRSKAGYTVMDNKPKQSPHHN